ncbi:MAG: hypothetical protein R3298_07650 [Gammaproteobacteria bacterium]|nr:hypothetical protein [Gammaproteobacteria bacterium]
MADAHDPRFLQRLAAQGLRLVDEQPGVIEVECPVCRTRWEIAATRMGLPHEDASADWWWCPNGCNRTE